MEDRFLSPIKEVELRHISDQTLEHLLFFSSTSKPDNQNAPDLSHEILLGFLYIDNLCLASRYHLLISARDLQHVKFIDLRSKRGTFLDSEQIPNTIYKEIPHG